MIVRPVVAVYVALAVLLLELVFPTSLLRIAATLLLVGGVAGGLNGAGRAQRIAALLLLTLTGWVTLIGVVLAPAAPEQQGIAIAFAFAGALALRDRLSPVRQFRHPQPQLLGASYRRVGPA